MQPQIIAHRGASYLAPENTLSAFRLAKELGANGIEMDIQQTRDKQLVIHHDYLIDLHTQTKGMVYDMLMGELKKLDFGGWKDLVFSGERIPTLAEAIAVGKEFEVMQLELKSTIDHDPDYARRVVEAVVDADAVEQSVVIAFDHDLLRQVKEMLPELRVGALTNGALESFFLPPSRLQKELEAMNGGDALLERLAGPQAAGAALELLENPAPLEEENCGELLRWLDAQLKALQAMYPNRDFFGILDSLMTQRDPASYVQSLDFPLEYLSCEYHTCFSNPRMVEQLHALGVKVALWTVDTEEVVRALLPLGPDALVTNRPGRVREWIADVQAERETPPEGGRDEIAALQYQPE